MNHLFSDRALSNAPHLNRRGASATSLSPCPACSRPRARSGPLVVRFIPGRDGTKLAVQDEGLVSQPAVLLLHEFATAHRCFTPMRTQLLDMRCVSLFARGYWPSDAPTMEEAYCQDVAVTDGLDALDALGIDQAHVVGSSMGAATALLMALRHPRRVRSLILIGAGGGGLPEGREPWASVMERFAQRFEAEDTGTVACMFMDGAARAALRRDHPVLLGAIVRELASRPGPVSAALLRHVLLGRPMLTDLESDLAKLMTPTLVLSGTEDKAAVAAGLFLARVMPQAQAVVLNGADHSPQLVQPELTVEHMRAFWYSYEGYKPDALYDPDPLRDPWEYA